MFRLLVVKSQKLIHFCEQKKKNKSENYRHFQNVRQLARNGRKRFEKRIGENTGASDRTEILFSE